MRYLKISGLAVIAASSLGVLASAGATAMTPSRKNGESAITTTGQTGSECPATEAIAVDVNAVYTGEVTAGTATDRECDSTTATVTVTGHSKEKVRDEVRRRGIGLQ